MLHKTFDLLESKTDAQAGTFEATVAVFGNVDRGGDKIMPGAFDETLAKWRKSGDPIPIILSHQWDNPMAHIGVADPNDVTPTTKGLHVKGKLDIADNDVAAQVHRLMARRSLKEFSFGYEVPKGGQKRKDGVNELHTIELVEAGPTLKGMNPATELHAVKSALEAEEAELQAEQAEQTKALREESERRSREIAEAQIPELPAAEPEPTEPEPDLLKELQEVKARLETTEQALQDLKKKAEETDKEQHARSVDPLRKRSEELALEIASDGMSLRKPPAQVTPKQEPVDFDALRKQSRDLMFEVLSYSTESEDK